MLNRFARIRLLLVCCLPLLAGCGGDSDSPSSPSGPDDSTDPSVRVSSAVAEVQVGETVQFVVETMNLSDTSVVWSVEGGEGRGTISGSGVFTAPALVPDPPQVTVRATSVSDPGVSGAAAVTITPDPSEPAGPLAHLSVALRGGSAATVALEEGFEAALTGIYEVSVEADALVNTGTFTFNGQTWAYDPNPNDQLVVVAPGAPTTTITWTRFFFAEDVASAEDLLEAHDVAGHVIVDGLVDLTFASAVDTRCCGTGGYLYTYSGTIQHDGSTWSVSERGEAETFFEPSGGVEYRSEEGLVADYVSGDRAIHIEYYRDYDSIFVDNFVTDSKESIASRYTEGGVTYSYVGAAPNEPAFVRSLTFNGEPSELELWEATGGVLRNGEVYGRLVWEGQLDGTYRLLLKSADGSETLIEY